MTMTYIQGEVQGHTGYLTFASVLHPDALQPSGAEVGEEQRGEAAGDAVAGEGGDAASAAATAAPAATGADNGNLSA